MPRGRGVSVPAVLAAIMCMAADASMADPKFISLKSREAPVMMSSLIAEGDSGGRFDLPQVGGPVPDGPRRIGVRYGDATLEDYARASLVALGVWQKYSDDMADATTTEAARQIAKAADAELAEALEAAGGMDYGAFVRMSSAIEADERLRQRAADILARIAG